MSIVADFGALDVEAQQIARLLDELLSLAVFYFANRQSDAAHRLIVLIESVATDWP